MEPFRNFAHRPLVRIWLDQGQGINFFFILFKAQKMNEMVQLTSGLWSFEISRLLSAATSKQIPFWSSNSFWVASSKARENSIDHNVEVSCTRSFIFCALNVGEKIHLWKLGQMSFLWKLEQMSYLWNLVKMSHLWNLGQISYLWNLGKMSHLLNLGQMLWKLENIMK